MKLQRYESIRKVTLSVCSLSLVILSFISINVSSEHTNSNAQRKQKFTQDDLNSYRDRVKDMFYHAYNNYIYNAYPYDELKPISCKGFDTWGSYSLTLIDSLDMLILLGNKTEFERVSQLILTNLKFDKDINVSVFETNIRIIGGLLSAHLLSYRLYLSEKEENLIVTSEHLDPEWPCNGPLLKMAIDIADRILPAFNTSTGMAYGTVNLKKGVPPSETTETCVAGVGTFLLEFSTLSRLTGDPKYEKAALRALDSLWKLRSEINMVGNHIKVDTGKWSGLDSTIGSGVDSYFEYLVKGGLLLNMPELIEQFRTYQRSIDMFLEQNNWFFWANMNKGQKTLPLFSSLEAFYPSLLTLVGDLDRAIHIVDNYHLIWRQFGSLPEFHNIQTNTVHANRVGYPLRPELIESLLYILRATNNDPKYFEMAVDYLESIERISRLKCGFATVKDVRDHSLDDRMESFFLAETLKYLYLIFDTNSFLHSDIAANSFKLIRNKNGECMIETGLTFFNTEAHPIDGSCLECCRVQRLKQNENIHEDLQLFDKLDVEELIDKYLKLKTEQNQTSVEEIDDEEQRFSKDKLTTSQKYEKFIEDLQSKEADREDRFANYCKNVDANNQLVNIVNSEEKIKAFDHIYPFSCSTSNSFRILLERLGQFSYYP